jgi:uncharacterized protein YjbI with pentapeptide repeats
MQDSGSDKVLIDVRMPTTGSDLSFIAEVFCGITEVREFSLSIQGHTVEGMVDFSNLGKLRVFKIQHATIANDVRIHEDTNWSLLAQATVFQGNTEFLAKIDRLKFENCKFAKELFIHGEIARLTLDGCDLQDVRLAPYALGETNYANAEYGRQSFNDSILRGKFLVDEVKATKDCSLGFVGLKLEQGSRVHVRRSAVEIDFRGVRVPSNCELLFEHNEERVFDFREMEVSKNANVVFRNQPLGEFLSCGTNLDRFSFSMVRFRERLGHFYLADDASATHLEKDFIPSHGCPDISVPKIRRSDASPTAALTSYRQLISYFDSTKDYGTAESLHYSEMKLIEQQLSEARLEKFGKFAWIANWFSLLRWYRVLASYGTSYSRAGAWLVALVFLVFPTLFLSIGLANKGQAAMLSGAGTTLEFKTITCNQLSPCIDAVFSTFSDYLHATAYTVSIATLQKEEAIVPIGWAGMLVRALVPPLVLGQLAIFLLALKRRFRRVS